MKYEDFEKFWKGLSEEARFDYALQLERRISKLEHRSITDSWIRNPDRMGGAYTEKEIADAKAWR